MIQLFIYIFFVPIPITFNNTLKDYFFSNTPDTNCKSVFLIVKPVFNGFLKIFSAQNQLPIIFCSDLVCNKTLKARN